MGEGTVGQVRAPAQKPDAPLAASQAGESSALIRQGLANTLGGILQAAIGLVLIPIMASALGAEAFGLWAAALATAAIASAFDLGLGWSVIREVAQLGPGHDEAPLRFIAAAGTAHLLIGLVGGLFIAGFGLLSTASLLGATTAPTTLVFALVGAAFVFDCLNAYAAAVLAGLRRYLLLNAVLTLAAVARAAGLVTLLWMGYGLVAVSVWHLSTAALTAAALLLMAMRSDPRLRLRARTLDWGALRASGSFSLRSQMAGILAGAIWNAPALLIGWARGPAFILPYYVGQKFPLAVSGIGWKIAEVAFPVASAESRASDLGRTHAMLVTASRWAVLPGLVGCLTLFVLAPQLLSVWMGEYPPETVTVLRLLAAAVLADLFGVGALHVLWGRGAAGAIVVTLAATLTAVLVLSWIGLATIGVAGVAWALLLPLTGASIALLVLAARAAEMSPFRLLAEMGRGLALPFFACAATLLALTFLFPPASWTGLATAAAVPSLVFVTTFYATGALPHEKEIVRWLWRGPTGVLARIGPLRSTWYLAKDLRDMVAETVRPASARFDDLYRAGSDPWKYESSEPHGAERFAVTAGMLDRLQEGAAFARALEIGCSEGAFTGYLAARCERVVAADASGVALERARRRCAEHRNVEFTQLDLARDPLPGPFELIVAMHVLEYLTAPGELRRSREKLAAALAPGGWLLVEIASPPAHVENTWWAKGLKRGQRIGEYFAAHPELEVVEKQRDEVSMRYLFQRKTN